MREERLKSKVEPLYLLVGDREVFTRPEESTCLERSKTTRLVRKRGYDESRMGHKNRKQVADLSFRFPQDSTPQETRASTRTVTLSLHTVSSRCSAQQMLDRLQNSGHGKQNYTQSHSLPFLPVISLPFPPDGRSRPSPSSSHLPD